MCQQLEKSEVGRSTNPLHQNQKRMDVSQRKMRNKYVNERQLKILYFSQND